MDTSYLDSSSHENDDDEEYSFSGDDEDDTDSIGKAQHADEEYRCKYNNYHRQNSDELNNQIAGAAEFY